MLGAGGSAQLSGVGSEVTLRAAVPPRVSSRGARCLAAAAAPAVGSRGVAPLRKRGSVKREAQFPGINSTEFTQDLDFRKEAVAIPIFRLLGEDGSLLAKQPEGDHGLPFSLEEAVSLYQTMVRVAVYDQILYDVQRQGRISFYMTNAGEEAAQVGTAAALSSEDVLWPQYRELGVFLHRGFTIQQICDQCMSRADEAGKGRQMPIHYCARELNIQAVTSPLATGIPHAAGAGYAFKVGGERRCAVAYFGDGAASEGDFAVALNFAATLKSQTIFVCRNNGWAISTPVSEQYAGDGIAARGLAYGVETVRVDGNDLVACYSATKHARELCLERGEPVLIELMTYRRGHHSTSDDATRYRPDHEVSAWTEDGIEPIGRMGLLLSEAGVWDEQRDDELRETSRREVMEAMRVAEGKKFAPLSEMFTDVYATPPPILREQHQELLAHIERHKERYDLSRFAS